MESHKSKVLRITKNIFDIIPGKIVEVTNNDKETFTFKCKCYDNNYDLYDLNDKNISWGMSCETLNDLRDSLLKDFLDGLLINIKLC